MTAGRTRARAVVVGAPTGADVASAVTVGHALIAASLPVALAFGGRAAGDAVLALAVDAPGAIALASDLGEAVATIASLVGERSPGRTATTRD